MYKVLYETARLAGSKQVGDEVADVIVGTFPVGHVESHHKHV